MPYYVQLKDDIVHTVCHLAEKVSGGTFVEIESIDETLLGKLYENGQFVDPPEPEPEPEGE